MDNDTVGDCTAGHFSVEYRRDGRLIAVDSANEPRSHMLARRRIANETAPVDPIAQPEAFEGAA